MSKTAQQAMRRFEVKNTVDGDGKKAAEVYLYDVIGESYGGLAAKAFIDAVNASAPNAETIVVNLNSPGGDAFDGAAIYNFLARHKAKVVVNIDGMAASAAATVAMAGDEIRIAENGLMMIHNAWGVSIGEKADLRKLADTLEKLDATIRDTYAARTGNTAEQIAAMMDAETWLDATEAQEKGFADSINQAKRAAALAGISPANLAKLGFRNKEKLAALTVSAADMAQPGGDAPPATAQGKEIDMSDKSNQAGQGGSGAAPATPAVTPAPENPGKKFLDAFGPEGGVWYAEGKTFEEAQNLYNASLKAANKALTDKADDLQKRLDAAIAANGATNPAGFDGKDDKADDEKAAASLAKLTKAFNGDIERAKRVLAQRAAKANK